VLFNDTVSAKDICSLGDRWVNMEHERNDTEKVKPNYTENNLSQC
jgi:hypothetical protein